MGELKRTPLFELYQLHGAKTIDFGGWELPVQFSSIKEEHEAVRTRAGLFDVSHMGEIVVKGKESLSFLQKVMTNDLSKLQPNQAIYTIMCNEKGGSVDDLLVYMLAEQDYLLVVNAANTDKDFAWLKEHQTENVHIENVSTDWAQLAIQGPAAEEILQKLVEDVNLSEIKPFKFRQHVQMNGAAALVSRTGYTGEDGFEIYSRSEEAPKLWKDLLEAGKEEGLLPCGLGARDTLRFEANLALYGQELAEDISPIEAGLGFAVKLNKGEFIGSEVLKEQKEHGPQRKLIGLEMIDRGIPRHGYPVFSGEELVGHITTGTQSPTLKKNIGLALVKAEWAVPDQELSVEIRGKKLAAKTVKPPFYKRSK
ncbi:glycine cleavage system aminomethyltransferase GcvT [Pseudobacillus badius]|uniref:glycine cleavage system aminomethyltransferase GcvT n=1 Tax=Bacillus badius TaxID=1455 RepID=UPI000596EBE3|nr:glycine cleavage system aminomethyltransferase GcvT [Bacillus badius]KIL75282.1 Aminomethyltransferase [Bacillus badius]KZR60363.1 glycine cleavage system protein T [Bacillus badius]